jgi:putative ABC transport system permease protein
MLQELRFAFRQLAKSPAFSAVALVALALGIGANTAIFSVINTIFLRPLPYAQPDRLVRLTSSLPERQVNQFPFSYPRYLAVREGQKVFSDFAFGVFTGFTVTGRGDPEQVQGIQVSADYLPTLGVQPLFGRNFTAEEDRPGGAPVVLLSHNYWKQHFNSDPAILGRTITLDGLPRTIVGILPPALSGFPLNQTELWTPRPAEVPFLVPSQLDGGGFFFQVIARLKSGVTLAQAQENVNVLAAGYRRAHPANADAATQADVTLMLEDLVGNQRRTYALLFGAVGCVLLIACANVANLLLARFAGRRKEIALRFALGAGRGHVIRQLLLESSLIALGGGALGLLLAKWGLDTFVSLGKGFIPRSLEISLDPRALAFTLGVALLTGLGMGLFPALQAARHDASDALKDSSRGSTGGAAQKRLRSGLLVGEIALSLVLLVAASLLLTSFARLQRVSPGFQPEGVFVGFLNLPPTKYAGATALSNFFIRLEERLAAIPGARSVAIDDSPPLSGNSGPAPIAVVGRTVPPLGDRPNALRHLVGPNSFATLGIPLLRGRDFNERDRPGSPETVIINQAFARQFFPGEDPVGRKVITGMGQKIAEVVGVVGDTHTVDLNTPPQSEYFLPALQRGENFTTIIIRTEGDPAAFANSVRAALREVDPDQPLLNAQALTTLIAQSVADRRLVMLLLAAFAGLALVLACIGVYSVMAYVVSQRTGEIGIRMALGASPATVQKMVLGEGLRLTLAGIGLGLLAAFALTRLMQKLLFEVQAHDPLIYAGISLLLCAVAAGACWIPARRATRVDPLVALRTE